MKISWIILFFMVIGVFFLGKAYSPVKVKNSEFVVVDTIVNVMVKYDTVEVVRTEVLRLPVVRDSVWVDSVEKDSVDIAIPISRYHFKDSAFDLTVSGFNVSLDRISVFPKTIYKIQKIEKVPKWGIGLQAGYGFNGKSFSPYVGIGVQINILSFYGRN